MIFCGEFIVKCSNWLDEGGGVLYFYGRDEVVWEGWG